MEEYAEHGYTVILSDPYPAGEDVRQDTALPFSESAYRPVREEVPERIREMRRLYEYGRESFGSRARNFYRQAVFMQDYEDDVPWTGDFKRYFPTYHDLTIRQLRGYFTWRSRVRRGEYTPIADSAAYIYIYELLNGVGASSPKESFRKMEEFLSGYAGAGLGGAHMSVNLKKWMTEFAVLYGLPPETARKAAGASVIEEDEALGVLKAPDERSDEEVFKALCALAGGRSRPSASPVYTEDPERGARLFSAVWRAAARTRRKEQELFTLFFGRERLEPWLPLSNAVFYDRSGRRDRDYFLDACRSFHCRSGFWQVRAYAKPRFGRAGFQEFLREADALLRRYCGTGRYLKEKEENKWADPIIMTVIEADRRAAAEAARPKITIDLSGLDRIRKNADLTRDSLLTGEELAEEETAAAGTVRENEAELPEPGEEPVQLRILRTLLAGGDPAGLLEDNHLMPSIAADLINEELFDEIGDNVLFCGDGGLSLVEDYREELEEILGGNRNG